MKWLLVTLLFCLSAVCNGQQMLTDKDFDMSQEGVTVVEFWADWNKVPRKKQLLMMKEKK